MGKQDDGSLGLYIQKGRVPKTCGMVNPRRLEHSRGSYDGGGCRSASTARRPESTLLRHSPFGSCLTAVDPISAVRPASVVRLRDSLAQAAILAEGSIRRLAHGFSVGASKMVATLVE
jgi:hypothetical protein